MSTVAFWPAAPNDAWVIPSDACVRFTRGAKKNKRTTYALALSRRVGAVTPILLHVGCDYRTPAGCGGGGWAPHAGSGDDLDNAYNFADTLDAARNLAAMEWRAKERGEPMSDIEDERAAVLEIAGAILGALEPKAKDIADALGVPVSVIRDWIALPTYPEALAAQSTPLSPHYPAEHFAPKAAEAQAAPVAEAVKESLPTEAAPPLLVATRREPPKPTHFRGVLLRTASDWDDPSAEGVFVGVSNEAYHADKASLSGSSAASYAESPAHAQIEKDIPARSRDIGNMVHGDILEGKDAAALGLTIASGKTTTKDGCVTEAMVAVAKACAEALRTDPTTAPVATLPGLRELSCRARCPETGMMLRCRFDLAPEIGAWAWDIKTTSAKSPEQFESAFGEFGYDISCAHYLRVAELVGLPYRAMCYPCVSTDAPHEVWLKKFGPIPECAEAYTLARSVAVKAAAAAAHGRATGEYPKRTHAPSVVRLKPWQLDARRRAAGDDSIPH